MRRLALISAFLFLSACGNYRRLKGGSEKLESSEIEKLSSDFDSVRASVFAPRCIVCHQQYANFEGVKRELSSIQKAVATDRMPKSGGPLSQSQKDILASWIAKGAPNASRGGGDPQVPQLMPNWASISSEIIIPKCVVCHNPSGQAKFLDLSTRQSIFAQRNKVYAAGSKLIDFDQPEKSYIIQLVTDPIDPMPPPPPFSNISRLTQEQVSVLTEWIALGLP